MTNPYSNYTKGELWKEITILVNATHFTDEDKSLFIKLIEEYSNRR